MFKRLFKLFRTDGVGSTDGKIKGKDNMSQYTSKLVAQLRETESHDYESAKAFAQEHGLSVPSVIGKINAEKLSYTPKTKDSKSPAVAKVTKADIVGGLASTLGVHVETIDGLGKSDMRSLRALVKAVSALVTDSDVTDVS